MSNEQQQPRQGEFCWNELMTPNAKQAKEFYCNLFGWESQDENLGHMTYTHFKSGEKGIGGMMQIPQDKQNMPPHWMSYIMVDNLDTMVKKAESLGAKVMVPHTKVPKYGAFAILQDPTGAHIALWQTDMQK